MKYKIDYWYEGTTKLLSQVIEAEDEKAAKAVFHDVYGNNRNYEILNMNPQPSMESQSLIKSPESTDNLITRSEEDKQQEALLYLAESKQLSGSKAALAAASESADKLTAYKSKQKPKEQEHDWFYSVDGENILGPVVFASIQSKVDKGILKEDSLVMKTGGDWMTVSEFKTMGTSSADKLTAYKARQTPKEQKPIWFYAVDGENISGPVVFASIQNKIDKGILKEGSLVMKTGGDWMTVTEFKTTGSSIIDAKPSPSFTQSHNAKPVPVKATASSPSSTQASDQPSPYSRDAIHFAQEAGSRLAEAPNKYPSLLVSFWFIYVLGSFLISLISGPLLSVFLNHQSDILETLTAKLKIMALIGFLYLLIAAFMVHLSSSEYRAQMFQWHYFARGIVFLHVLLVGFRMFEAFQY